MAASVSAKTPLLILFEGRAGEAASNLISMTLGSEGEVPSPTCFELCIKMQGNPIGDSNEIREGVYIPVPGLSTVLRGVENPTVNVSCEQEFVHPVTRVIPAEGSYDDLPQANVLVVCRHGSATMTAALEQQLASLSKAVQPDCIVFLSCSTAAPRLHGFVTFSHRPDLLYGKPFLVGFERAIFSKEFSSSILTDALGMWLRLAAAGIPDGFSAKGALKVVFGVAAVKIPTPVLDITVVERIASENPGVDVTAKVLVALYSTTEILANPPTELEPLFVLDNDHDSTAQTIFQSLVENKDAYENNRQQNDPTFEHMMRCASVDHFFIGYKPPAWDSFETLSTRLGRGPVQQLLASIDSYMDQTSNWKAYLHQQADTLGHGDWETFATEDVLLFSRCVVQGVRPALRRFGLWRHILIPMLALAYEKDGKKFGKYFQLILVSICCWCPEFYFFSREDHYDVHKAVLDVPEKEKLNLDCRDVVREYLTLDVDDRQSWPTSPLKFGDPNLIVDLNGVSYLLVPMPETFDFTNRDVDWADGGSIGLANGALQTISENDFNLALEVMVTAHIEEWKNPDNSDAYTDYHISQYHDEDKQGRVRLFPDEVICTEGTLLPKTSHLRSRVVIAELIPSDTSESKRSFAVFFTDCHYGQDIVCAVDPNIAVADVEGGRVEVKKGDIWHWITSKEKNPFRYVRDIEWDNGAINIKDPSLYAPFDGGYYMFELPDE